ncbi:MAG: hypothetical protein ACYCZ3_11955 [Thiobacillus sp.]
MSVVSPAEGGDHYNMDIGAVAVDSKRHVRDLDARMRCCQQHPDHPAARRCHPPGKLPDHQLDSLGRRAVSSEWDGVDIVVSSVNTTIRKILPPNCIGAGSAAFIKTKFTGFKIVITLDPGPQPYALFPACLGLIGLGRVALHAGGRFQLPVTFLRYFYPVNGPNP